MPYVPQRRIHDEGRCQGVSEVGGCAFCNAEADGYPITEDEFTSVMRADGYPKQKPTRVDRSTRRAA